MARVPVGGELVKNPVQGPPGFTIGNVFVLAGVPQIMRGMLEDVGPRLKGGAVTVSRTVRVEGSGEGVIAAPLEAVAKAHPAMSLGSYPFFGDGGYGSNLVLRGRDPAELAATVGELIAALQGAGVENVREIDAERIKITSAGFGIPKFRYAGATAFYLELPVMIVALLAATCCWPIPPPRCSRPPTAPSRRRRPAAKKKAENQADLVCKSEPVLGSRMPVHKCRTASQAAQEKLDAQAELERAQGSQANNPH